MRNAMWIGVVAGLLLALGLSTMGVDSARAAGGIVGEAAPTWEIEKWFNLPEGKEKLEISDFRGKVLILFNFQSW